MAIFLHYVEKIWTSVFAAISNAQELYCVNCFVVIIQKLVLNSLSNELLHKCDIGETKILVS